MFFLMILLHFFFGFLMILGLTNPKTISNYRMVVLRNDYDFKNL